MRQKNLIPRSLTELRIADNMARIALNAMSADDERRSAAIEKKRATARALREFIYHAKPCMSQNGKLLRP